jgi:hypothetical protein
LLTGEKIFFSEAAVEVECALASNTVARILGLMVALHFIYMPRVRV